MAHCYVNNNQCCSQYGHSHVANHFQIIAEGANGPTTAAADEIFLKNNVLVIPVRKEACFH